MIFIFFFSSDGTFVAHGNIYNIKYNSVVFTVFAAVYPL